jgi:low affinity Fe/Cu permease
MESGWPFLGAILIIVARAARALHLKPDEIILAIHPFRNEMIDIERLSDDLELLTGGKIRMECESRTGGRNGWIRSLNERVERSS